MNVVLHFNTTLIFFSKFTLNKYFNFSLAQFLMQFKFVFYMGSLVNVWCLMIISFHSLICV